MLSALSGILLAASMPGFDVPFLGWIALVPLLIALITSPAKEHYGIALPFGLILSIGVHNWYPDIFSPSLGYFLILAVGTFYAGIFQLGAWLYIRLHNAWKLLSFPVAWSAIEFIKFITPVVENWWFVLLAKSMWRFPPALQILSVTGFPGLSFLIILANVAIALILLKAVKFEDLKVGVRANWGALGFVAVVLIWSALTIPAAPLKTFTIGALTDMILQDPDITGLIKASEVNERLNNLQRSQDIFEISENLTWKIIDEYPQVSFIVWAEDKIASMDNEEIISQISALAKDVNAYIVVNLDNILENGKIENVAVLFGPDGEKVGQRAKIHLFGSAAEDGFQVGEDTYPVFDTLYGKVGVGICYDYHFLDVVRNLADAGAGIVLMPTDDDFDGNGNFPPFHASDGVFRAAENRVTMGLANTNGLTLIIDPYGRITAEGKVNQRGTIVGETFIAERKAIYTRFGDWFGWLMVLILVWMVIISARVASRK